jgi:hypothetical protein
LHDPEKWMPACAKPMKIWRWIVRFVLAVMAQSILLSLAVAQSAAPPNPEMAQACPGLVAGNYLTLIPRRGGHRAP